MIQLTVKEIYKEIDIEDICKVNNLLQEIMSSEFAKTGIDVIRDKEGFCKVIKGTTLKVKVTKEGGY